MPRETKPTGGRSYASPPPLSLWNAVWHRNARSIAHGRFGLLLDFEGTKRSVFFYPILELHLGSRLDDFDFALGPELFGKVTDAIGQNNRLLANICYLPIVILEAVSTIHRPI